MNKQYSIAEARDHLPSIVHEVEEGEAVELTRRGKTVAVLLSIPNYRRLKSGRTDFWTAYQNWRRSAEEEGIDIESEIFEGLRDKSPGREFNW